MSAIDKVRQRAGLQLQDGRQAAHAFGRQHHAKRADNGDSKTAATLAGGSIVEDSNRRTSIAEAVGENLGLARIFHRGGRRLILYVR